MIERDLEQVFESAGCRGWLCVIDVDSDAELSLGADDLVATASVFKVPVALEACRQISAGELDARSQVRLNTRDRTLGPSGFSTFDDDVDASFRDLVRMMLTISDNAATDVVIDSVGLDRIHATLSALGLPKTVIPYRLSVMLDSLGEEVGFGGWRDLLDAAASPDVSLDEDEVDRRLRESRALSAQHGIRTTAREMAMLLRMIWRDEAGPADACATVRKLMAQQLVLNRIAIGFPRGVGVAAKSGSLLGVIRNEIGVVSLPDGRRYAAAVFTRTDAKPVYDNDINLAIGKAAAMAIAHVQEAQVS